MNESPVTSAHGILNSCRRLVNIIHTASKATEKSLGLSAAQHYVLQKLADGEARSVNELAQLTYTHQSSVSVVARKLVEKKLLMSQPAKDDGRRNLLKLSPAGRKVLTRHEGFQVQDQVLGAILSLSSADQEMLNQLLGRILNQLQGGEGPAPMFLENSES